MATVATTVVEHWHVHNGAGFEIGDEFRSGDLHLRIVDRDEDSGKFVAVEVFAFTPPPVDLEARWANNVSGTVDPDGGFAGVL